MANSFTSSPAQLETSAGALGSVGQDLAESVQKSVEAHGITNPLIGESVEYLAVAWQERFQQMFEHIEETAKLLDGAGKAYEGTENKIAQVSDNTGGALSLASTKLQKKFQISQRDARADEGSGTPYYDDRTVREQGGADISKDLRP